MPCLEKPLSQYKNYHDIQHEFKVIVAYEPAYERRVEMREWVEENATAAWSYRILVTEPNIPIEFTFADLQDATLFRLKY